MEPNAAIFEHVTKMGRIGIPTAHKSEPVYRQPSYDFDDLTDTPLSTVRSIPEARNVYVDMKLGRNMRARPKQTDDGRSNGQTSDKDLIESLNRQKQTRRQLEFEKEYHQAEAEAKRWKIEERTQKEHKQQELGDQTKEIMQRGAAAQQEKDWQQEVEAEKRKKQHEQIQKSLLQDSFPLADSLLRTNSPFDEKEQTSAKVIFRPLDTESQNGLTKSKNVGDIHVSGVITEKDSDEDDDFILEKVDSSKEDSDINDF
ncbi:hypothetical protein CHS0354_009193 [Potamilus streckersoni]|uniref:Uncharacterized protein n=1 Tax=Potamilus streckersoni TaxID=2493646 RepID=A0AAE0W536_9BIVA|nr:hypothetical protein CHS0354_009193 [Potamilus streckersoni]